MRKVKYIWGLALVGLALNASAVPLSFSDYGVGTWAPGSDFNSDPTVLSGVKHSVEVWNGTALPGLYTEGSQSATFVKGAGVLVPVLLPEPLANLGKDETPPFASIDNSGGLYSYLLGKYGNESYLFYIGGLNDSAISLPTSFGPGGGLSHQVVFSARTPDLRVPDAGATALLLGLGLVGLLPFTRKVVSH